MPCKAFEDCLEDGTAENDHVLGIGEIGRGFLLRSGSEGCGGKVLGRWSGGLLALVMLFLRVVGEVGAGDLEGVEKETGAARIDIVGGDTGEDPA